MRELNEELGRRPVSPGAEEQSGTADWSLLENLSMANFETYATAFEREAEELKNAAAANEAVARF